MKRGEQTKLRMVEATGRLLQSQGYFGTGVKQILADSGAPRGSFYHHYPGGKEQLAIAALEHSGHEWRERLQDAADAATNPGSAIRAVCGVLAESLVASEFQAGCPMATVALEAAATIDSVHKVCSAHFRQWQQLVAARLAENNIPEAERPALATLVVSAVEGALMLARAYRNVEPLYEVGVVLAAMLDHRASHGTPA